MSALSQSASFNSSVTSSQPSGIEDLTEMNSVKSYIKDLLRSRIFLGRYTERRLVNQNIGYRDIVSISPAEVELKKDLIDAKQKLQSTYNNIHWIGITDSDLGGLHPSGVCIWTEIDNQPFGPIWFQIKSVKFRDDEIILILKSLRHISDAFLEIEPILVSGLSKRHLLSDGGQQVTNSTTQVALNESYKEIVDSLKSALTISNVKEFFTFLFAFVIAIFTGTTAFINFVGNFILALMREISILVKNSTPMFLGFLDFLSKIVGGFYILIAMFFKPTNPVPVNKRTLSYGSPHRSRDTYYYNDRDFD